MKLRFFALLALAMSLGACHCSEKVSPVLDIEGGQVQGIAADLDGVFVYKGIPYAAPPIGELRWKAPQPVQPWTGLVPIQNISVAMPFSRSVRSTSLRAVHVQPSL